MILCIIYRGEETHADFLVRKSIGMDLSSQMCTLWRFIAFRKTIKGGLLRLQRRNALVAWEGVPEVWNAPRRK
jgi:hypothetical protein